MTLFIFQIKMYENFIYFVTNFWSTERKKNGEKNHDFQSMYQTCHNFLFYDG